MRLTLAFVCLAVCLAGPKQQNTLLPSKGSWDVRLQANATVNNTVAGNATQPAAPADTTPAAATTSSNPWVSFTTRITGGDVAAGASEIPVRSIEGFKVGDHVRINPGGMNEEDNMIKEFASIVLTSPLQFTHSVGEEIVSIKASASDYTPPLQSGNPDLGGLNGISDKIEEIGLTTILSFCAAAFGVWFLLVYLINLYEGKKGVAALPFGSCCAQNRKFEAVRQ